MSAERTIVRAVEMSPRLKARIAGVLYLLSGEAYSFAESSVLGKLMVPGDAAATARNILTHPTLYRLGFTAELIETVLFIAVTLLLYSLFRPVNRDLALLAASFSLAGSIVYAVGSLLHLAPLILLGGSSYLQGFSLEQLQGLALGSLALRADAANIFMVFFGCYNLLLGGLILRSAFMPRILGAFMALAGLAYQAYLWPPLATRIFPWVLLPAGALGELSLVFWLIVFGVNSQRWKEQAGAGAVCRELPSAGAH
jgi:hypothetical protein